MAKQKSESAAAVAEAVPELKPKRFRVHLAANTPLAYKTHEFDAETPEEAWEKFCDLNGISGSSCERTITEV